ncbi:uncharacterized protein LOC129584975 [Paramacrobiotus metropolitanus]|uniref:uncharacterized protein LOC129584975 n=1 Tax=Paramacrobiotus metropolitanus TaxID=2943436 RepID=UPI002445CFA9|nr:uncharacterized protein LOC129584975 [Paramacrobiotus metropolitanus]
MDSFGDRHLPEMSMDARTTLHILLRMADELSTMSFVDTLDLDTLGYGHLSPEGLNTLLLQAAGPDALEYEELTGTDVNLAVLDTLLLNGADIACRDSDGNSPLYRAVLHDQLREAEFLLEKGAPINDVYVNANDLDGETCLTTAVQLGNAQMVRMLLRCGADVNAIDGPGLVWFCALHRDLEILTLLVSAGANLLQPDALGDTLVDVVFLCAAQSEHDVVDFVNSFEQNYETTDSSGQLAAFQEYDKSVHRAMMQGLGERIHCLIFIMSTAHVLPDPMQIELALHLNSFYTVASLYFWCLTSGATVIFPEYITGNFLSETFRAPHPYALCGAEVLMEIILRNEASHGSCQWVLDFLAAKCQSPCVHTPVQRLKHICLIRLRKVLADSKFADVDFSSLVHQLKVPEAMKHIINMDDLKLKIERNREIVLDLLR